jgi:hypothetical protein
MDEGATWARSRRRAACIRVDIGHWDWDRAAALLEAMGGQRALPAGGTVFRFLTSLTRDNALRLVQSKYGTTVARPFDDPHSPRPFKTAASASPVVRAR